MRHRKKQNKFSRPRSQRKALIKSMIRSVLIYERVVTTEAKAKRIKANVEKLITLGKRGDLHSRRLAYDVLGSHQLVKRLFEDISPRFKDIEGGYTRVLKINHRKGDGAELALLELTKRVETKKAEKVKAHKHAEKSEDVKEKEHKRAPRVEKPKKGFMKGVKKIFKKERDAL